MKRARRSVMEALIGRKIVDATCERWDGAQDGSKPMWVHTWTLILDSGARVSFLAEETEVGAYGVDIRIEKGRSRDVRR
jgi:hypothetical protein